MKNQRSASPADVHVGLRLRLRRLELGISQEKMADGLGITFQQIQKYEKGTNRISAGRLLDIAKALGVPVAYFFEGIEATDPAGPPQQFGSIMSVLEDAATLRVVQAFARIPDQRVRSSAASVLDAIVSASTPGVLEAAE